MKGETTNPELLRSLREADSTEAWLRFEQTYRPRILRHCRSVGLTLDQSDEVIQECFIKCFRYLPSFDYSVAVGRFRAWLNLTVNQRIAEVRRASIRSERLKAAYARVLQDMGDSVGVATSSPSSFEYELVSMVFQRTQAEVDPRSWQVFEAHAIHGLSSVEIGRQFEVSAVWVRVTTHRVRNTLRRIWRLIQEEPF